MREEGREEGRRRKAALVLGNGDDEGLEFRRIDPQSVGLIYSGLGMLAHKRLRH